MELYYDSIDCNLGEIYVIVNAACEVVAVELFKEGFLRQKAGNILNKDSEKCLEPVTQLSEYFQGKRKCFDLNLCLQGTEFQKKVWNTLLKIPYGETRSYSDIAAALGNLKAVRAVGGANRVNKIPIIVPCHRVIGKNRTLVGYAGSHTDKQEILLALEGVEV
jgi:methylated-DNA-[protein]-cysteine S-methyltransferase